MVVVSPTHHCPGHSVNRCYKSAPFFQVLSNIFLWPFCWSCLGIVFSNAVHWCTSASVQSVYGWSLAYSFLNWPWGKGASCDSCSGDRFHLGKYMRVLMGTMYFHAKEAT